MKAPFPFTAGLSHMSDGIDEIVVIPGAFLDAMADRNVGNIGGLQDVSGEPIEEGCVGGSIVFAGTAEILIKMYVEHPMQAILDLPMSSGEAERLLRRQKRGGHEQAHRRLGLIAPAGDADGGISGSAAATISACRHSLRP